MVVESREPRREPVACIATGSRFQYGGVAGRSRGRQGSVVALRRAGSGHNACVIKAGRNPGMGSVTPVAGFSHPQTAHVARRLASRNAPVVACRA